MNDTLVSPTVGICGVAPFVLSHIRPELLTVVFLDTDGAVVIEHCVNPVMHIQLIQDLHLFL